MCPQLKLIPLLSSKTLLLLRTVVSIDRTSPATILFKVNSLPDYPCVAATAKDAFNLFSVSSVVKPIL